MVDKALDPDVTKRRLIAACAEEMHFAFGIGDTPENCVLALDPKRTGKALFALIRKEHPEIKQVAFGTSVPGPGKEPTFTSDKKLPKTEAWMNKMLKTRKITIKVSVD